MEIVSNRAKVMIVGVLQSVAKKFSLRRNNIIKELLLFHRPSIELSFRLHSPILRFATIDVLETHCAFDLLNRLGLRYNFWKY